MGKGKQTAYLIAGLLVVFFLLFLSSLKGNKVLLGMEMLIPEQAVQLEQQKPEQRVNMQGLLVYNEKPIAYDVVTNTIYISQKPEGNWQGTLAPIDKKATLYWVYDQEMSDKKKAIQSGHIFQCYYVTDTGYAKTQVVCTGLPVLSYTEDQLIINDTENVSDGETSKVVRAKITAKLRGTNPYEADYRIRLLENDTDKKRNLSLLGMDKNDDWELHSLYTDDSMMRERMASTIWNQVIQQDKTQYYYGLETAYTEVLINNQYVGVYNLSEHADGKSLELQEEDLVWEDVIPVDFQSKVVFHEENRLNYFLLMQLLDGKDNLDKNVTFAAKKLAETNGVDSYRIYFIPDKLRNIYRHSVTELLNPAKIGVQQTTEEIADQYEMLREQFFSLEQMAHILDSSRAVLQDSGAIVREQQLRKRETVETGIENLYQFCQDRLNYLDRYYGYDENGENSSIDSNPIQTYDTATTYPVQPLQPGIPTVTLTLDESKGTIQAMEESKDNKTYGEIAITVPEGYTCEYTTDLQRGYQGELKYLRCRGQSSFVMDKKSYKIELKNKVNLFGMGANRDWILLSNVYDDTMLRNKMAYWLSDAIGLKNTSKSVYVNLIMNGKKMGCYLLMESVKVDDERIDLQEPDERTNPLEYSYLVEIMPEGRAVREENYMKAPYSNTYFGVEYPKNLASDSAYFQNIATDLLQFDTLLYGQESFELGELEQIADVDSIIDYFWIQEIFKNTDTMYASVFFYQDAGGRLTFGPEWDFDLSVGANNAEDSNAMANWYARNGAYYERLFRNQEFAARAIQRYQQIRPMLNQLVPDMTEDISILESYVTQMQEARLQNFDVWEMNAGESFREIVTTPQETLGNETAFINLWMKTHIQWLDENLDSIWIQDVPVQNAPEQEVVVQDTQVQE